MVMGPRTHDEELYEREWRRQQDEQYAQQALEYALHTFGPVELIVRLAALMRPPPPDTSTAGEEPF